MTKAATIGGFRAAARKFSAAIVIVTTLILAAHLLGQYLNAPRARWVSLLHDRWGHYDYGLKMAMALEQGDVRKFLAEIEKGKAWGPLHGLLVSITQMVSRNDWRLAVLPSLAGWMMMCGAVYLTARRVAGTELGWAAGLVAFILAVLSPGQRMFATDVMLESLGAGLTMLTLAAYAFAAPERNNRWRWRALGLSVTLLFFEKVNYWLIAVAALLMTESGVLMVSARKIVARVEWSRCARQPFYWCGLVVACLAATIYLRGPTSVFMMGRSVSLYPPENLVTIAYAFFFAGVAITLRDSGWGPQTPAARAVFFWAVLPIALSFLLPKRLAAIAHYLSPMHRETSAEPGFAGGVSFVVRALVRDYHSSLALALIALALFVVALVQTRSLPLGGKAVVWCALIGAVLTILHPYQESRFSHSWIPAVWTGAGIGAAMVWRLLPRPALVAGATVVGLVVLGGAAWSSVDHATEATGEKGGSLFNLSAKWRPELEDARDVTFVATQPCRAFAESTFYIQFGTVRKFHWLDWPGGAKNFAAPVTELKTDAVVILDIGAASPDFLPQGDRPSVRTEALPWLTNQFPQVKRLEFPERGWIVTICKPAAGRQ